MRDTKGGEGKGDAVRGMGDVDVGVVTGKGFIGDGEGLMMESGDLLTGQSEEALLDFFGNLDSVGFIFVGVHSGALHALFH